MPSRRIKENSYEYNEDPDQCPICHHGIEPIFIAHNYINSNGMESDILQMIYRCPRKPCQLAFIGTYSQNRTMRGFGYEGPFCLRNTAPYYAEKPEIPPEIKQLSPIYVEVYSQSIAAEASQLDQIAGVGYRKSLEYLIKDYAIYNNPEKVEDIKKAFLGSCINDYVEDENVKACAKLATWLGNDETHPC